MAQWATVFAAKADDQGTYGGERSSSGTDHQHHKTHPQKQTNTKQSRRQIEKGREACRKAIILHRINAASSMLYLFIV